MPWSQLACDLREKSAESRSCAGCTQLFPLLVMKQIVSVCHQTDHICLASPIARSPSSHLIDRPRLIFGLRSSISSPFTPIQLGMPDNLPLKYVMTSSKILLLNNS